MLEWTCIDKRIKSLLLFFSSCGSFDLTFSWCFFSAQCVHVFGVYFILAIFSEVKKKASHGIIHDVFVFYSCFWYFLFSHTQFYAFSLVSFTLIFFSSAKCSDYMFINNRLSFIFSLPISTIHLYSKFTIHKWGATQLTFVTGVRMELDTK